MLSVLTDPSLPVDTKYRSQSTTTYPKRECHNVNREVEDIEATLEPEEESGQILEPGGLWRWMSSKMRPTLRPIPIVCHICGSYTWQLV